MSDPCERYVARQLLLRGIEWEKSLPQTVWILTLCRRREVFQHYEPAREQFDQVNTKPFDGRCDFPYMEKFCTGRHTLAEGLNEIPMATFGRQMIFDEILYSREHPEHELRYKKTKRERVEALPPFRFIPSANPAMGVVYMIQSQDPMLHIKIGRSFSATDRLDQLQTGNPYELVVLREIRTLDVAALEQAIQRRYAQFNVRGEWFNFLHSGVLEEVLMEDFVALAEEDFA